MSSRSAWSWAVVAAVQSGMLVACSGTMDQPRAGAYRAAVTLQDEELPLQLEVANDKGQTRLWLINGARRLEATAVRVSQGHLDAQLPEVGGLLSVDIRRKELVGTLTLGTGGALPVRAVHGATWLFFEKALTDNADMSGRWQLECGTSIRWTLDLQQSHDRVSGELRASERHLAVDGQVHGDTIRFTGVGPATAMLYRGEVNAQGSLQGALLDNSGQRLQCAATHMPAAENAT